VGGMPSSISSCSSRAIRSSRKKERVFIWEGFCHGAMVLAKGVVIQITTGFLSAKTILLLNGSLGVDCHHGSPMHIEEVEWKENTAKNKGIFVTENILR
jgi:hypothetical protein